MSNITWKDIEEELDLEFFLDRESIQYKHSRGSSGNQLNIRTCPNPDCQDNNWKTYFGVETGFGNCFKCDTPYNKAKFVHMALGNDSWRETFKEIEGLLKEQGWKPRRQAPIVAVNHIVKLPNNTPAYDEHGNSIKYLADRGIDGASARYFDLRVCENGWWIYQDEKGETRTQIFDNRLIIPVYDLNGDLVTFQGRDMTGESEKKYLFPRELPGTGRYLLNGVNAVATKHVVMGEGFFDVAAIKMAFDEVSDLRDIGQIGSFGKHLSYGSKDGDDQLSRLRELRDRGIKTVTMMWDGEEKALIASLNACKLMTGIGIVARIALLPHTKDPNEVPAHVVRDAFYSARTYSSPLDIKWRLKNPYSARERAKYGL